MSKSASTEMQQHARTGLVTPSDVGMRVAGGCTTVVLVLMSVSGTAGLAVGGVYGSETAWASAAFRGGDLVSLAVVPVLLVAMLSTLRGSRAAAAVWGGLLAYDVYNYGYYVVGARFNDLFLLHVAVLALSGWGLVFLLPSVRSGLVSPSDRRAAGIFAPLLLGSVALVLGGLWVAAIAREAVTGALPTGPAPASGLHTVYAVDLTLFVSSLVVATMLAWRRTAYGLVAVPVMCVAGATYLVNLMVASFFQARAGVDVAAFSPGTLGLTMLFVAASATSLRLLHRLAPRLGDAS